MRGELILLHVFHTVLLKTEHFVDSSALNLSFYYMNKATLTGMVLICHAKAPTTIFTIRVR